MQSEEGSRALVEEISIKEIESVGKNSQMSLHSANDNMNSIEKIVTHMRFFVFTEVSASIEAETFSKI